MDVHTLSYRWDTHVAHLFVTWIWEVGSVGKALVGEHEDWN